MAVRAAAATGNLTTAGTWGLVDSTSYLNDETATHTVTTAFSGTRTAAFTPGAITVDGIGVKLSVRTGTTGTLSVHLALNSTHVEVSGTLVTINCSDLPAAASADLNGGWIFFKFASPVTLAGATAYELEVTTSSASQVGLFRNSTSGNVSRYLRTTTAGAPAAGDDMIVTGEWTSAGSQTALTVTMDETAATDYGNASGSLVTPSLAICQGGTLSYGTTAATNYVLRQSGNVVVYSGGIFNIGTTGTPIPRDGSAVLEFDCSSDGDPGLTVRNLGTWNAQGLSRTSGKNIVSCKLNTDEAASSTSLGVDTDTGWLDNDEIAVASTTQTPTQCEKGALNGNAGASTLTVDGFGGGGGGLAAAHSGTSPIQAEVILLTRNVRVRSVSSTNMSYINVKPTSSVNLDWVEMYYLGDNVTGKRGLNIETTSSGSFTMDYSSLHDCEDYGVYWDGASVTFSMTNNVFYNLNSAAGGGLGGVVQGTSVTSTTWVFSNNIVMRVSGSNSPAVTLFSCYGTFDNNVIVGSAATGVQVGNGAGIGVPVSFSGNTSHSNTGVGFSFGRGFTSSASLSIVSTLTAWRNAGGGLIIQSSVKDILFSTGTLFGNTTFNIDFAGTSGQAGITFVDYTLSGDSTFATTIGVRFSGDGITSKIRFVNADLGTATGIKVAHSTADISVAQYANVDLALNNSKLASTTELSGQANMTRTSAITSQKHDQTAGLHKTWLPFGTITIETTTTHTGGQSVKLTPISASNKLVGPSFYVAVASGQAVTPAVYVYEDASYNGARARLIVKRNDALGITSDTVLDTATAASDGAWELLTGTTANATDDGVMEFVVDCDGTAGNLFVDSFSAT